MGVISSSNHVAYVALGTVLTNLGAPAVHCIVLHISRLGVLPAIGDSPAGRITAL